MSLENFSVSQEQQNKKLQTLLEQLLQAEVVNQKLLEQIVLTQNQQVLSLAQILKELSQPVEPEPVGFTVAIRSLT